MIDTPNPRGGFCCCADDSAPIVVGSTTCGRSQGLTVAPPVGSAIRAIAPGGTQRCVPSPGPRIPTKPRRAGPPGSDQPHRWIGRVTQARSSGGGPLGEGASCSVQVLAPGPADREAVAWFLDVAEQDRAVRGESRAGHLAVDVAAGRALLEHDEVAGDGLGAGVRRPAQEVVGGVAVLAEDQAAVRGDVAAVRAVEGQVEAEPRAVSQPGSRCAGRRCRGSRPSGVSVWSE